MPQTVVTDGLMEAFAIEGARPLSGSIRAAGNKNAALPIIAACLLTDEPVTLTNVPAITDVETMLELAAALGADVDRVGGGEVRVTGAGISKVELDEDLCSRIRASILFAGRSSRAMARRSFHPPVATSSAAAGWTRTSTRSRS